MSLLILIFLINATEMEPLADSDSLEVKTSGETTSEDNTIEYSLGFDTYSVGFNKKSISTNAVEEIIDVSNGTVSLKIKLTSLPMRGNKDYDVYLTYRGSPLSVTQAAESDCYSWRQVDLNDGFLVTSDIGTCGLGWNVMPGEFSVPGSPGSGNIEEGDVGFTCINGDFYTLQKTSDIYHVWWWYVLGKEDWAAYASNLYASVTTPEYKYTFENILDYGQEDPEGPPDQRLRLDYMLTKMEDKNGNYVRFTWQDATPGDATSDIPPAGRIPDSIITPTSHCKFYPKMLDPLNTQPCWEKFYLIDSLVHWVNDGCYTVKFYYTAKHLDDAIEYWYVHETALLDSISFYFEGQKMKPSYKFFYDNNTGELVRFITPDGAEYSYLYGTISYLPGTVTGNTKYRRINRKIIDLPDDSGDIEYLEYRYTYAGGTLAESSVGEIELNHGVTKGDWSHGASWPIYGYYPIYKKCKVVIAEHESPRGDSIVYWHIDDDYLENKYRFFEHEGTDPVDISSVIVPNARKFIYGKPYKVVKYDKDDGPLELERLYWAIDSLSTLMPGDVLRPTLKCKAVQKDPSDLEIVAGDTIELYEYNNYDRFGNKREYSYLGNVECTGIGWESIESTDPPLLDLEYVDVDKVDNERVIYEDLDEDDSWKVEQHFKHEEDHLYIELVEWCEDCYDGEGGWIVQHRMMAHLPTLIEKRKITGELISKTENQYDVTSLTDVSFSVPDYFHSDDFDVDFKIRGNLTKKTEWMNEGGDNRLQQYWYDICGNLIQMKDYMGEDYFFEYDSDLFIFPYEKIYPKAGLSERFLFNDNGYLTDFYDKNDVRREFQYDCFGRLTMEIMGGDVLNEYEYDDFDRIATAISYSGIPGSLLRTINYYYDNLGRLEMEEFLGESSDKDVIKEYFYDRNGRMFKETAPRFRSETNFYIEKDFDFLDRVTEIVYAPTASPEIVEYFYKGDMTVVYDEEGDSTKLINNASGNLIKVVDALYVGDTTCYDYDANGNFIKITDTEEKEIDFEYDWLGNLIRREGPDRGVDIFAYYADGNTRYHILNSGDEIEFEYDELGRIESKLENNQVKESYYYDSYDIGGDNYDDDAPSGLYHPAGRLTGFQNENVREVYFYDKFGNLCFKKVIPFIGSSGTQDFEYSYDLQGRLTQLEYPNDYTVGYSYDRLGNIYSIWMGEGQTLYLSFTAAGLLERIDFPGGTGFDMYTYTLRNWMDSLHFEGPGIDRNLGFLYNKKGELLSELTNYGPTKEYEYDPLGRLTLENIYEVLPGPPTKVYEFDYDKVGNRTSVNDDAYDYETGTNRLVDDGPNTYAYNDIGCISSKTNDIEGATNFYYDAEGNLTGVELPGEENGYKYYYKGHQRIREEKITDIEHTQILEGILYSCKLKWEALPEAVLEAVFMNDENNEIGTLTLVSEQVLHGTHDWIEFSEIIPPEDLLPGTHTVKLRVRIVEPHPDAHLWVGDMSIDLLWGDGGISGDVEQPTDYFYDNAGNLILVKSLGSGTAANVVQNPGFETGDLSGWSASGGAVDGYYFPKYEGEYSLVFSNNDSVWQEISLSETAGSPIIISCWVEISCFWGEGEFELKGVLKGDGINEEHSTEIITGSCDWTQLSLTIDSIPEGTSSCEIKLIKRSGVGYMFLDNVACELEIEQEISTKYIYAGSRLLAKDENGQLYFYHLDRLGSPVEITNESGVSVKRKEYEAFGNLYLEEGTYEDNREFTGKEKDPTGFHYFGARYYYANIGRFLSPDPNVLFDLANPRTLNPYVYCHNDPINYFDPFGLTEEYTDDWPDTYYYLEGVDVTASGIDPYEFFNYYDFYVGNFIQQSLAQRALRDSWRWWLWEGVQPGPGGAPYDEWDPNKKYNWGDPMKYTEEAGGVWMWSERTAVYGTAVLAITTLGLGCLEMAGYINTAPQANNIIRIISPKGRWGWRLDKPHPHNPHIHQKFWRW